MPSTIRSAASLLLLIPALAGSARSQAVVEPLPPSEVRLFAYAGDGYSATGAAQGGSVRAARWTPGGTVEVLWPLTSYGSAISWDGTYIAGVLDGTGQNDPRVFRWSAATGIELLPPIPGHDDLDNHAPAGVSADGEVVVTKEGLLWTGGDTWFDMPQVCSPFVLPTALTPASHHALGRCGFAGEGVLRWDDSLAAAVVIAPGDPGGISYDGRTIALSTGPQFLEPSARPQMWREGLGVYDLDLLAGSQGGNAFAVSGSGEIAGGTCWTSGGENTATLWIGGAPHDVNALVDLPGGAVARQVVALSEDGLRLFLAETSSPGAFPTWYVDLFPLDTADDDQDGLLNGWETTGIPFFGDDGSVRAFTLEDADPQRKDLYVELDVMTGVPFGDEEVGLVEDSFFAAAVGNPGGGAPGITLHVEVEQGQFDFEETVESEDGWPPFAATIKAAYFGSEEQRADLDGPMLLAAKRRCFRYGLVYNEVEITTEGGAGIGGQAEIGGDDMVLYLGSFGTPIERAATFMHELGHNLGLLHGGGDDINGKPNYPSIMNYTLASPMPWSEGFWRLDFSREELPALDESFLDEGFGIGGGSSGQYSDFFMPYYSTVAVGADCYPPSEWGQPRVAYASLRPAATTDFNLDCDHDDLGILVDLNYLELGSLPGSEGDPTPGELLFGWNDWEHVVLPIGPDQGAFAAPPAPGEVTLEQLAFVRESFPPAVLLQRYCFGGSCPCGNDDPSAGCANSTGTGASLDAGGSSSLAADDLVLEVSNVVPDRIGLVYFGGAASCSPLGDGLLAVSPGPPGRLIRLQVLVADGAGRISYGPDLLTDIASALGSMPVAGETLYFQGFYRDAGGPCGSGFNFTNGLAVTYVE